MGTIWRARLAALVLLFCGDTQALAKEFSIVTYGDSLMAGYGLPKDQAFPAQLEAELAEQGIAAKVVDASVSGDTTAGGLARLGWTLSGAAPDLILLALGANDGLRGIDPADTKQNLDALIGRLVAEDWNILLVGMLAPRNLGPDYQAAFDAIYPALADKHDLPLYPFILDGVATDPSLNQSDGIHPNAAGVAVMAEKIAPAVIEALR